NCSDKRIVVNATALESGGGLSILHQFVANIPNDDRKWLFFVSPIVSVVSANPNVRIVPIHGVKSMPKRLWWDAHGLKKWLKKNRIEPTIAISLQNTGFSVGKEVPTKIYYHNSIPFFPLSWNPLKKQERRFWFYKNIYPFFVSLFLKRDTEIFVQLEFIKEGFAKRFNHPKELINVYCPSVTAPKTADVHKTPGKTTQLVYPALLHFYKNHRVIEDALKLTDADVEVTFTLDQQSHPVSDKRIRMIGLQPYDYICELYRSCDALLFPSYIETFGLPLLEAAMTGMPIIAADLPYAREVLAGYEGATFVPYNGPKAWAHAIESVEKGKRFKPINVDSRPGWKQLFETIKY
ncbi:MAG: glycosyltransferase, partial [Muribaculaceae bacterium]|nr:glycosyltransferase [Muribaculaceae bacterium]